MPREELRIPITTGGLTEVVFLRWLKPNGASVQPGDVLYEIELDKVTMEVPSDVTGTLVQVADIVPNVKLPIDTLVGWVE
jgi:pyruvate/2-oxoglutarate dehydrogenase complex dihydrolipoamide acyltransferase (E2) component